MIPKSLSAVILKHTMYILVALSFLIPLSCPCSVFAKTSEKEVILSTCVKLFGQPVDEALNLFQVNQAFVLQVRFSKDWLEELIVKPNYFFNDIHPEWEEPDRFPYLSKAEYEYLVRRLDRIKPKGKLRKPRSNVAVVTNSTAYYKELYAHAKLEWGELAGGGIRFFTLSFGK